MGIHPCHENFTDNVRVFRVSTAMEPTFIYLVFRSELTQTAGVVILQELSHLPSPLMPNNLILRRKTYTYICSRFVEGDNIAACNISLIILIKT